MARKISMGIILRPRASGLSEASIARSQQVSKTSVMDTLRAAVEKDLSLEAVEGHDVISSIGTRRPRPPATDVNPCRAIVSTPGQSSFWRQI